MHLNPEGLADAFVFNDHHLLQVSHPCERNIATMQEHVGPISVVKPMAQIEATHFPSPTV